MLLNGKEVNNLIINGEKFSKNGGEIKIVNHQVLKLDSKMNGNVCILSDTSHDLSAYINKRVMVFYTFKLNNIDGSMATATEPFTFTGQDTVATVTNDGDVWIYYYSYEHELTINCQSQWSWNPKPYGGGLILELAE